MDTVGEVQIENLSNWLKSMRLNSGTVLHIPPHTTSQTISGIEVYNNTEVDKLLRQCAIAVHSVIAQADESQPANNTERSSKKKSDVVKTAEK